MHPITIQSAPTPVVTPKSMPPIDPKVSEALKELESVFLEIVFTDLMPESEEGGFGEQMWGELLGAELGKALNKSGFNLFGSQEFLALLQTQHAVSGDQAGAKSCAATYRQHAQVDSAAAYSKEVPHVSS